ncbi:MAG: phosphatase PAP2 family protein [Bacteroidaceae bacterium]|nr:phosphatase PAP2 family protein [Bacteroidaceae bacterium]
MTRLRLLTIEKAAALYCAFTLLLMIILYRRLSDPWAIITMRAEWAAMTAALIGATFALRGRWVPQMTVVRTLAQMAWLIRWYPDTYEFNRSASNLDHLFAATEQHLFGCQPALLFSQALPQPFWSEAFNLGYWSYYPMIAALTLAALWRGWHGQGGIDLRPFQRVGTTILASFFLYYAIYIFLPVAGPQFYFQAVGLDAISSGHFPALGTYFSSHTEMLPAPGWSDGFFHQLVAQAQEAGERPTAAFPSSHIGISTIVLLLSRRFAPRLTPFLLPFWALLCCATVYIQAHYAIDALAGLFSAPIILWIANKAIGRNHYA